MKQIQNRKVAVAYILMPAFFLLPFFQNTAISLMLFATIFLLRSRGISPKQAMFLVVLFAALYTYLWFGAEELRPIHSGISLLSQTISALDFVLVLFLAGPMVARKAIQYLSMGTVILVFLEGILTIVYYPVVAIQRFMIYPITGDQVHSTGQINAMTVAVGFLLLLSGRKLLGVIALLMLASMALAYANRTGMIFSALFFMILLFQFVGSVRFSHYLLALACMLIFASLAWQLERVPDVINFGFSRFSEEGLASERFDLLSTGLEAIMSGEHPYGGAQLGPERAYPWYHNMYLDAYRAAGFPALALFIVLTLLSAHAALRSKSKSLIFVWWVALGMTMTSVPIEGAFLEYAAYFSIFSYAFVVERSCNQRTVPQQKVSNSVALNDRSKKKSLPRVT